MKGDERLCLLAERASMGDENAFIEICDSLKFILYKTAVGILADSSLALEAVDESVFKAFKGIRKLKQPQYIKTWFVRILLNVCNDIYRKRQREDIVADIPENYLPKDFCDFSQIDLEELVGTLPKDLKQIVSMKYFSDLTLSEIAEILCIPIGTVKSKLNRALKHLRLEVNK